MKINLDVREIRHIFVSEIKTAIVMYKFNRAKDVFNNEYRLRAWVELYKNGHFSSASTHAQIDAGWYDWWCKSVSLLSRLNKLAPKVIEISKSETIVCRTHHRHIVLEEYIGVLRIHLFRL